MRRFEPAAMTAHCQRQRRLVKGLAEDVHTRDDNRQDLRKALASPSPDVRRAVLEGFDHRLQRSSRPYYREMVKGKRTDEARCWFVHSGIACIRHITGSPGRCAFVYCQKLNASSAGVEGTAVWAPERAVSGGFGQRSVRSVGLATELSFAYASCP